MKTLRIVLCMITVVFGIMDASAEEFFPTGTSWTEAWLTPDMKFDDARIMTYEVGTDTLIGSTTYKRILIDGEEKSQWLREEDGKVLLLRDDFPQEIMLYHFDWFSYEDYPWWKTDDTTYRQYIQNGELKEDTIHYDKGFTGAMRDGKDRPRISFHQSFLKVDIIRGIGQTTELNKNCCILGSVMPEIVLPGTLQCRLLTFSRNGKLVYDFEEQFDASSFFTRDVPTAGLDVYFFTWWRRMFQYDYQCIDSLVGNNIHISAHYNKQPADTIHKRAALINMGSFEAGEYKVVLTAVDNSSQLPDIVHEYPFTVKESPVDVPRGLIHTSVANEKEKSVEEAFEEGFIPDCVTPVIDATLEGDSLHITGWLRFQICDHWCYYEIHGDSIYLETVERNNPGVTGGWPLYSIDFKIGPFTGDHCTIQVAHVYLPRIGGDTHYRSTHTFDFTPIRLPKEDVISNTIFDLTGRPSDGTKKGIYILGGKKVLVK